jgi:hypothetical protein
LALVSKICHLKHLQVSETIINAIHLVIKMTKKRTTNAVKLKDSGSYFLFF